MCKSLFAIIPQQSWKKNKFLVEKEYINILINFNRREKHGKKRLLLNELYENVYINYTYVSFI